MSFSMFSILYKKCKQANKHIATKQQQSEQQLNHIYIYTGITDKTNIYKQKAKTTKRVNNVFLSDKQHK